LRFLAGALAVFALTQTGAAATAAFAAAAAAFVASHVVRRIVARTTDGR
jgi:hypothetical protein